MNKTRYMCHEVVRLIPYSHLTRHQLCLDYTSGTNKPGVYLSIYVSKR
jgi:hypothetical protein